MKEPLMCEKCYWIHCDPIPSACRNCGAKLAQSPSSGIMVGGRFDGHSFPPDYCHKTGEIVAVNFPGHHEDVYRFDGKNLIYDDEGTKERAMIFDRDGEWGEKRN